MTENHRAHAGLGAVPLARGGWNFTVWAPQHERLELHLLDNRQSLLPTQRDALGYHSVIANNIQTGAKYFYRFSDSHERPDPASRRQPE